ncbi:MAG: M81 family metallopeptidase, partial [Alphaproteobacteria bacterium]
MFDCSSGCSCECSFGLPSTRIRRWSSVSGWSGSALPIRLPWGYTISIAQAPRLARELDARQCLERGEAISRLARQPVSHLPSEMPGFYKRMDETGPWVALPILVMAAPPGGPIDQSLLNDALDEMRAGLAAVLPLDGVYIANHGASSATGDEDSDGTMAAMMRAIVGPAVPILCTHDLHCNISEKLIGAVDAFIGYRTNPHVDMRDRAAEAADLLREALSGQRFARGFVRLPITPPSVSLLTARGPYADRMVECEALMARDPRIANASICGGFVFSDLPKCGMTITVTTRGGDQALADAAALEIARATWADRQRYVAKLMSLADITARATAAAQCADPILIADVADNPGGGGRGNTAYVLRALHEAGVARVVLANFVDPDLAEETHKLGEGARFTAQFNRNPSAFS